MDKKPVILVVDDDLPIIILMRSLLREFGFQAVTATNGAEAIEKAQQAQPELILLDKNMPGMTCGEVIRGLREGNGGGRIPILILSGEPLEGAELRELGADAAVQKPFDIQALIAQIRSHLDRGA
jgi:CheY-like chemotaxis protein